MNAPLPVALDVSSACSPEEWAARVELAAAYRVFDYMDWTELIYNHISSRVPGGNGEFLINPFGLHYSEVCASNLIKVTAEGQVVGDSKWPVNPAGVTFHAAIHRALPAAHCVMHLHTTATQAVCSLQDGLSFTNFYAAQLWGKIAYHAFEGITIHPEEGDRMLASAQGKPVLLLRNHGPVVMGFSVANAFGLMWILNRACEVQWASMAMGPVTPISEAVLEGCVRDSLNFDPKFGAGQDAFDALVRLVERSDPSFKN